MDARGPWTESDFEALSWHDVSVYGIRLENFSEQAGTSDLVLDIDYILEWLKSKENFEFRICRAELRFFEVFGLRAVLDYASPTAGMCPFSIQEIARTNPVGPQNGTKHWKIAVNWPRGEIEFDATGFRQTLIGEPRVRGLQHLDEHER